MKKVNYDNKPSAIEAVGNGSYLYRWGIEEVSTIEPDTEHEHTSWDCYEVTIWNTPTENSITEVVVDALWGGGVEQKLLNDYQASQIGVLDISYAAPYAEFLAERKAIKEQITVDYAVWVSNN